MCKEGSGARLSARWYGAQDSLWFIPALMTAAVVALPGEAVAVRADSGGYVQAVNADALLGLDEHRVRAVRIHEPIGAFVLPGESVASVWATHGIGEDVERRVVGALVLYIREFPYLWEEMSLPIRFGADRDRVEAILLAAANRHAGTTTEAARASLAAMRGRYFIQGTSVEPQVYYRLADSRLELTLRFVTEVRGVRDVKDAMSREILRELDAAGIGLASATYEIVGVPELRIRSPAPRGPAPPARRANGFGVLVQTFHPCLG